MANTKEFFLSVTQRVFSNWTALKMAVEHGMGTRESATAFCEYITEVIYMNENINSGEIASELEDCMDDQFNIELEDGSAVQVAEELLRFYKYCTENNETLAMTELQKLPPVQSWLLSTTPVRRTNQNSVQNEDGSSSESEEDGAEPMEVADNEWTEVRTRRKR